MLAKKFKYAAFLCKFQNCPPDNYVEMEGDAYRWVHSTINKNDFLPRNVIQDPPQRILDDSDLMCKGYGLSLFDTDSNAIKTYSKYYLKRRAHLRPDFITEFGDSISLIAIKPSDGVGGDKNQESGHFTFHEYEDSNLNGKITNIFNIFDDDGEIVNN